MKKIERFAGLWCRMESMTDEEIAREAFLKLEDEEVDHKIYGHEERAIQIILAAIKKAKGANIQEAREQIVYKAYSNETNIGGV